MSRKKWQVLKTVTLKDIDGERYAFKDKTGRTYFLDNTELSEGSKGLAKLMQPGDETLVWVVKELETYGFIKLDIDGMHIAQALEKIPELVFSDLYKGERKQTSNYVFLCNYLKNSDSFYSNLEMKVIVQPNIIGIKEHLENKHELTNKEQNILDILWYLDNLLTIKGSVL